MAFPLRTRFPEGRPTVGLTGNEPWLRRPGGGIGTGGGGKKPPGLTPDQWAQQQAEKYISAQVAAIEAERKAYLDELARQAELRAEQGRRLAEALQGMNFPGRIQGVYQTAGSDLAGMAQGFSGNTRDIAAADAAEQMQMLSGTGQEGAVRNEGDAMGNVLYGVGGFIPGRALGETGAAFAADAALQPGFAMRQAAAEAARIQEEGMGELGSFASAIAKIKAEKPGLVQDLLDRRTKSRLDQQEFQMKRLAEERDWYLKQAALANAMGDDRRSAEYLRLARERERRMQMQARGLDMDGNPLPGYKIAPNGMVVKVPTPRAKSTKTPKGPDWGDIQKDIASEDLTKEAVDPARPWAGAVEVKMSYQEAYNALWAKYSGLVKDKARLKNLIRRILKSKGIVPPKKPGSSNLAPGTFSGDR